MTLKTKDIAKTVKQSHADAKRVKQSHNNCEMQGYAEPSEVCNNKAAKNLIDKLKKKTHQPQ
jgi:hypothetical protein